MWLFLLAINSLSNRSKLMVKHAKWLSLDYFIMVCEIFLGGGLYENLHDT